MLLTNLKKFNLEKDLIVLSRVEKKPSRELQQIEKFSSANFHYFDIPYRENYLPGVIPALLNAYWKEQKPHPFFLVENDLIFLENLDWSLIQAQDNLLSETKRYNSVAYLRRFLPDEALETVTKTVDLSLSQILQMEEKNDIGGAQFWFRDCADANIWKSIETDSYKIYVMFLLLAQEYPSSPLGHTAFMFSMLWNLWKHGIHTKTGPELDFYWPADSISYLSSQPKKKILHNSGITLEMSLQEKLFWKLNYVERHPFSEIAHWKSAPPTGLYIDRYVTAVCEAFEDWKQRGWVG